MTSPSSDFDIYLHEACECASSSLFAIKKMLENLIKVQNLTVESQLQNNSGFRSLWLNSFRSTSHYFIAVVSSGGKSTENLSSSRGTVILLSKSKGFNVFFLKCYWSRISYSFFLLLMFNALSIAGNGSKGVSVSSALQPKWLHTPALLCSVVVVNSPNLCLCFASVCQGFH